MNDIIKAPQVVITTVKSKSRTGYQTIKKSAKVLNKEKRYIYNKVWPHGSLSDFKEDQILKIFSLPSGRIAFNRIKTVGKDYVGRTGALFTHTVILSKNDYQKLLGNPFCFLNQFEEFKKNQKKKEYQKELPLSIPPLTLVPPENRSNSIPKWKEDMEQWFYHLLKSRKIAFLLDKNEENNVLLESLLYFLPLSLRTRLSINSFVMKPWKLKDSDIKFDIVMLPKKKQKKYIRLPSYYDIYDLNEKKWQRNNLEDGTLALPILNEISMKLKKKEMNRKRVIEFNNTITSFSSNKDFIEGLFATYASILGETTEKQKFSAIEFSLSYSTKKNVALELIQELIQKEMTPKRFSLYFKALKNTNTPLIEKQKKLRKIIKELPLDKTKTLQTIYKEVRRETPSLQKAIAKRARQLFPKVNLNNKTRAETLLSILQQEKEEWGKLFQSLLLENKQKYAFLLLKTTRNKEQVLKSIKPIIKQSGSLPKLGSFLKQGRGTFLQNDTFQKIIGKIGNHLSPISLSEIVKFYKIIHEDILELPQEELHSFLTEIIRKLKNWLKPPWNERELSSYLNFIQYLTTDIKKLKKEYVEVIPNGLEVVPFTVYFLGVIPKKQHESFFLKWALEKSNRKERAFLLKQLVKIQNFFTRIAINKNPSRISQKIKEELEKKRTFLTLFPSSLLQDVRKTVTETYRELTNSLLKSEIPFQTRSKTYKKIWNITQKNIETESTRATFSYGIIQLLGKNILQYYIHLKNTSEKKEEFKTILNQISTLLQIPPPKEGFHISKLLPTTSSKNHIKLDKELVELLSTLIEIKYELVKKYEFDEEISLTIKQSTLYTLTK